MEKFIGIFVPVFGSVLLIMLIGGSYGFRSFMKVNYLADAGKRAHWLWKIPGTILILFAARQFYMTSIDEIQVDLGGIIFKMFLPLAMGICVNCGFNFKYEE